MIGGLLLLLWLPLEITGATPEARSGRVLRYFAKSFGAARRRRAPRWQAPPLPVLGDERLDWVVTFNEQLKA